MSGKQSARAHCPTQILRGKRLQLRGQLRFQPLISTPHRIPFSSALSIDQAEPRLNITAMPLHSQGSLKEH